MKLRDCAVKAGREGYWLRHLTSSYRVRLDEAALSALRSMLGKSSPELLTPQERLIFDKLSARGIAVADAGPAGPAGLEVRRRSLLSTVELELSSACNLVCGHCFARLSGRHMSETVLDKALSGGRELEAMTLVLNGGEPLLSPLFRRAVESGRGMGLRVVVMTNGTLVTRETAAFLARQRAAKVIVSLDFFEPCHDALRGPGSFRKACHGIRLLASAGLAVFVTAMAREESAARAHEFARFCREELGVAGVRFSAVMPIGRAASAGDGLGLSDASLKALAGSGLFQDDAMHRVQGPVPRQGFDCSAGVEQCFVSADGSVYACHYFQNIAEPMGNLADFSLAELHAAASGSVCSTLNWSSLAECRSCPAFASCRGGCRARARLLGGNFSAPDPVSCRLHR